MTHLESDSKKVHGKYDFRINCEKANWYLKLTYKNPKLLDNIFHCNMSREMCMRRL